MNKFKLKIIVVLCWCLASVAATAENDDEQQKGTLVASVNIDQHLSSSSAIDDHVETEHSTHTEDITDFPPLDAITIDSSIIESSLIDTSSTINHIYGSYLSTRFSSSKPEQNFIQRAACNPKCTTVANLACAAYTQDYSSYFDGVIIIDGVNYESVTDIASTCEATGTCTTTTCYATTVVASCGQTCTTEATTLSIIYSSLWYTEVLISSDGAVAKTWTGSFLRGSATSSTISELATTCLCGGGVGLVSASFLPSDSAASISPSRVINFGPIIVAAVLGSVGIWVIVQAVLAATLQRRELTNEFDLGLFNQQFLAGGQQLQLITNRLDFDNFPFLRTPINTLHIPVTGSNFTGRFIDGCGDSSVRMKDGKCYPLLRQGSCSNPRFWLTIDPISLKGKCTPRLCGRNRVFVRRDGLCHDASDPAGECGRRGRRLYYTAFGDPICECPLGQFPFPGPYDPCYKLFTRGPCPPGHVLLFNRKTGALECSLPSPGSCHHKQSNDGQQQQIPIVTLDDGSCHIFSSSLTNRGPCDDTKDHLIPFKSNRRRLDEENLISPFYTPANHKKPFLLGFDVFKQKFDCYNVTKLFPSRQAEADLDAIFDPLSLSFTHQNKNHSSAAINEYSLPDQLLNPCRPGSRSGINFKCSNPILPSTSSPSNARNHPNNNGNTKIPYRPAWTCPNFEVLQANGQCIVSAVRRRTTN